MLRGTVLYFNTFSYLAQHFFKIKLLFALFHFLSWPSCLGLQIDKVRGCRMSRGKRGKNQNWKCKNLTSTLCLPWSWSVSFLHHYHRRIKKKGFMKIPLPLVGKTDSPTPKLPPLIDSMLLSQDTEYCFDRTTIFTKKSTYRWLTYSSLWILSWDSTKEYMSSLNSLVLNTHTI